MNILRLTEGQQGRLDCGVQGAYPAPTITWSGPIPGPGRAGVDRFNRNAGEQTVMENQFRGNITVIQEVNKQGLKGVFVNFERGHRNSEN